MLVWWFWAWLAFFCILVFWNDGFGVGWRFSVFWYRGMRLDTYQHTEIPKYRETPTKPKTTIPKYQNTKISREANQAQNHHTNIPFGIWYLDILIFGYVGMLVCWYRVWVVVLGILVFWYVGKGFACFFLNVLVFWYGV